MSAIDFYEFHKSVFEAWHHGEIVEIWIDEEGNTCILYSDGSWYHYRSENSEVIFW